MWVRIDSQGRDLRGEIKAQGEELRDEIKAQGRDLRGEIKAQGEELRGEILSLHHEMLALHRTMSRIGWSAAVSLVAAVIGLLITHL